jgi:hypothetical protein
MGGGNGWGPVELLRVQTLYFPYRILLSIGKITINPSCQPRICEEE